MKDDKKHMEIINMSSRVRNLLIAINLLPKNLNDISILDCGCGHGSLGFLMKTRFDGNPNIDGFDLYRPYINRLKKLNLYDSVYVMDIKNVHDLNKKYDYIFAMEVLEHLKHDEALDVLKSLESMCNKMLIISMPIGQLKQGIGIDDNIHYIHKSAFYPKDFEALGYETKTILILTRILSAVNKVRCLLFGLDYNAGNYIAWKRFGGKKCTGTRACV